MAPTTRGLFSERLGFMANKKKVQQELSEEEKKIIKFFEDGFKDGDMINNKAKCELELQKKEWTGIRKTDTEELRDVMKMKKNRTHLFGTA